MQAGNHIAGSANLFRHQIKCNDINSQEGVGKFVKLT